MLLPCAACLLLLLPLTSCSKRQQQPAPTGSTAADTAKTSPEPTDQQTADYDVGNVILISVDTLRADRLNCYGYRQRRVSPNIDALAADGILFDNHIAASPWTTPAHLSMFTSLHPTSHGITTPFGNVLDQMEQGRPFNKLPGSATTLAEVLTTHGFTSAAFTGGVSVDPQIGFDQGFMTYTTNMYRLNEKNMSQLIDWFDSLRDLRLFVFWHTFELHAPYLGTSFLDGLLPPETVAALQDYLGQLAGQPINPVDTPNVAGYLLYDHGAYNLQVTEAMYVGGIHSFDRWFGRLIQSLRELGQYDRSLIIFTSDHGEEFADHDPRCIYNWHGHTLYEELLRIPLIIKLPGQRYAGTRVSAVCRTVDIMPTILDTLSIPPTGLSMQGVSLRPLWEQPDSPGSRVAFSESLNEPHEKKGVRTDRYKYIVSVSAESVAQHGRHVILDQAQQRELYDLLADPVEKVNLLDSPQREDYLDVAAGLDRSLREHLSQPAEQIEGVQLDPQTIENLRALGYIAPRPDSKQP